MLAPALAAALDQVRIDPGGTAGAVGDTVVAAENGREFRARLAHALYRRWHLRTETVAAAEPRRDLALERELSAAVPHEFTLVRARTLAVEGDRLLVERSSVRTWVPAACADGAGVLRVPAVRPRLSPGFFLADGSRGAAAGLRVYLHVRDAADALTTWGAALSALEGLGARYRAKVVSGWPLTERADGMTVYLGPGDTAAVAALASLDRGPGPRRTSVFAEPAGPGITTAAEPDDPRPGMGELSFGEHRARVVADALARQAATPAASRHVAVVTALLEAGIDPLNPARNGTRHRQEKGGVR